jgi:hypothetical protein
VGIIIASSQNAQSQANAKSADSKLRPKVAICGHSPCHEGTPTSPADRCISAILARSSVALGFAFKGNYIWIGCLQESRGIAGKFGAFACEPIIAGFEKLDSPICPHDRIVVG